MKDALERAVQLYKDKEKWQALTKKVMETDFSWDASAKEYSKLYDELMSK